MPVLCWEEGSEWTILFLRVHMLDISFFLSFFWLNPLQLSLPSTSHSLSCQGLIKQGFNEQCMGFVVSHGFGLISLPVQKILWAALQRGRWGRANGWEAEHRPHSHPQTDWKGRFALLCDYLTKLLFLFQFTRFSLSKVISPSVNMIFTLLNKLELTLFITF